MKLYVFNPDADMALGNNEENYMAPATIRRMAEDLALLPIWYAQPGSGTTSGSFPLSSPGILSSIIQRVSFLCPPL